jgi:hypothetical protein
LTSTSDREVPHSLTTARPSASVGDENAVALPPSLERSMPCIAAISSKPPPLNNALPNKHGSTVRRQNRRRPVLSGRKQCAKLGRRRPALKSPNGCPHPAYGRRNEGTGGPAAGSSRMTEPSSALLETSLQIAWDFRTAQVGSPILSRPPKYCKVSRRSF